MKIIIPAKQHSTRVPNKNWREFHGGKNLVQIKIEQLLKYVNPQDIYLSTDNMAFKKEASSYGINFIERNPLLALDDTPWPDAFKGIIQELPLEEDEDIAWVEVINPIFESYRQLFEKWAELKDTHDSLVLTAEFNKFILDSKGRPLNFIFGKWHSMSQNMEPLFIWDSACIMSKKNMLYYGYPIGKKPYLYSQGNIVVDIDTMEDFRVAQLLYTRKSSDDNQ